MPECGSSAASAWDKNERSIHQSAKQNLHPVGFEPTSTNTFELESNPLDRSGKNAYPTANYQHSHFHLAQRLVNTQDYLIPEVLLTRSNSGYRNQNPMRYPPTL